MMRSQMGATTELRIKALTSALQRVVYESVCRALFKSDHLVFALHLVHAMYPKLFAENVRPLLLVHVIILYSEYFGNDNELRTTHVCPLCPQEWEWFTGALVPDVGRERPGGLPAWIDEAHHNAVAAFRVRYCPLSNQLQYCTENYSVHYTMFIEHYTSTISCQAPRQCHCFVQLVDC